MAATYDVIVVGGGAVGAACARELARAGRRVLVLERGGGAGAAWRAAAGMLAPQIEAERDDPLFELGVAARDHYEALAPALREATGIDVGLWREGIARVARDEAEAAGLRGRAAWQRARGQRCEWLEPASVRARWPWLAPSAGALWAEREGALEPERLVRACLADAARLGAEVVTTAATVIERRDGRAVGVATGTGRYAAGDVVLAAGAWSRTVGGIPRPVSVEPVRGQMAAFPWPEGVPRAVVYGPDSYVVARGGEAVVGSTMEYVGFDAGVTTAGLARVFSAVAALAPDLARLEPRRTWAGLRPVTPDGLPLIGPEPRLPGLWYATGHGRNGILLAGLTGVLIARLLAGEPPGLDLASFAPDRFWRW